MRKYASALVLAAAQGRIPDLPGRDGLLSKSAHRAVFSYVPKPGFVYVRSRAISSRCNDNFDYFGPDEIEKSYRSFEGKPVFVNHVNDNHKHARGLVLQAALHRDRNPDGSPDTWVEVLMEVDGLSYPKLAKALLNGDIDRTSMGTDVQISKCSYCGNEATSPLEYCQHIPGKKGQRIYRMAANGKREGVLVFEICSGLHFFENSLLVEPPADPTAYFLGNVEVGPGLEHIVAQTQRKAAVLKQVIDERPVTMPVTIRGPERAVRNLQHTAAAGDDWSVGMGEERRKKAEDAAGRLFEGWHQIMDPGSTPESRTSDRNMRVMNNLQGLGYQPHHIKFNADDDDHPYAEVHHPSGWYARDHSGPHLEIMHPATGEESHDLINLQHYDPETREQHRMPGYGPAEAEQDLHHWVTGPEDETGGAARHLEQHDPRIKRWMQRRRMGSATRRTAGSVQDKADAYLKDHPIKASHIVDRVKAAAADPNTLHSGMKWYEDAHGMAKTMASHHDVPLHHVAGTLGVYSASSAPAPNFHMTSLALHAGRGIFSGRDKDNNFTGDRGVAPEHYDLHGDPMASAADGHKVDRILSGDHYEDVINSNKTKTYARLIHNPDNHHDVVIDRHAVAAAVGHTGKSGEPYNAVYGAMENVNGGNSLYNQFSSAYREAAHHINTHPEFEGLRGHLRKSGLSEDGTIKPHQVQALAWIMQKHNSDQHGHDMGNANQTVIDAWQNHYTNRYGDNAHQPVSGKGFYGQEPHQPAPTRKAAMKLAYNETKAPQDVDTLRDERCVICGNDTAYNGRECLVCGYMAPPKALGDPDVDKAKQLDDLKQSVDGELGEVDPSRPGGDFDAGDLDQLEPGGDNSANPWLECNNCGTALRPGAPQTVSGDPATAPAGPAEGDACPVCQQGQLASTGTSEDDTDAAAMAQAAGAPTDETEAPLPGGRETTEGPSDDEDESEEEQPEDDEEDPDDEDDEDNPVGSGKKLPASKNAAAMKYRTSSKEFSMQQALASLIEQQQTMDAQAHLIVSMQRRLAVKDSQIQRLTAGLQAIAQYLGPEADTMVRTAMVRKHADEQNPAQPVPEPAPEPPSESSVETKTPEAFADVRAPGMVPGSNNDVAADAVSTAYTPGQDLPSPAVHQLVDVTRPIDGTQGPRPLQETKTNVDVRVGNPMNPQVAFPVGGPFANAQRTSGQQHHQAQGTGDLKLMASLRLARLRIAAGLEQGGSEGADLMLAQRIASDENVTVAQINHDIEMLNQVQKAAGRRQPVAPPPGVVPRSAQVQRTMPVLSGAGFQTTASADDNADLMVALMGNSLSGDALSG